MNMADIQVQNEQAGHQNFVEQFITLAVDSGYVTAQAIERARRVADAELQRVDLVLNRLGLISDQHFTAAWHQILELPIAEEHQYPTTPVLADALRPAFLQNARAIPLKADATSVCVALGDPLDMATAIAIQKRTGLSVQRLLGKPSDITRALDRLYRTTTHQQPETPAHLDDSLALDVERLRDLASDAPVIRLVQSIIQSGVETGASDIHLSLSRTGPRLRLRVDGLLRDVPPPAPELYGPVVSRIKILAGLDIAEQRLPQDGSMRAVHGGREIDLRVATMPHVHGEGVVLRILDKSTVKVDLDALGISPSFVQQLTSTLAQPSGLVLMTGPTGSGKTTTLYAALKATRRVDRNVVTIEDPVEYQLDGVTQISINHKIGFDFAKALRAVLRQDPDVIMVGEIRDHETAQIASRAALTGHLVIATVHTNSAIGALPRLIDMGVEPYLVASTVRATMAQRLVRRLCEHCRVPVRLAPLSVAALSSRAAASNIEAIEAYEPRGCERCNGTGYRGRIAICEFIPILDTLRQPIVNRADAKTLTELALSEGARLLADDALSRIFDGTTSVAEVERVMGLE